MTSVLDVVRTAREAVGAPTLTRESTEAARAETARVAAEAAAKPEGDAANAPAIAAPVAGNEGGAPVAEAAPADAKAKVTFKSAYVSDDGVIYLIGAYAGNVDLDNDILQTKALVDMSYDFTAAAKRTFKANHKDEIACDLVASMPGAPILKSGKTLKFGEDMPEGDEIIGIDLKAEPIAWFVGVRPHDKAVAEKAKAGEIVGASWGAYCDRIEITE